MGVLPTLPKTFNQTCENHTMGATSEYPATLFTYAGEPVSILIQMKWLKWPGILKFSPQNDPKPTHIHPFGVKHLAK